MKKILVMLGVMLFAVTVFAQDAVALSDEECQDQKDRFEQLVDGLSRESFIAQNIIINLADPMVSMTDEQAQPLAVCYAKFRVKGTALVDYVRSHANIFREVADDAFQSAQAFDKLEKELLDFADRTEKLSEQAALDRVASYQDSAWVIQHVLSNLADPMSQLSDEKAAPKAKVYKQLKVDGQPLMKFIRAHANEFAGDVPFQLDMFVSRVHKLAK